MFKRMHFIEKVLYVYTKSDDKEYTQLFLRKNSVFVYPQFLKF